MIKPKMIKTKKDARKLALSIKKFDGLLSFKDSSIAMINGGITNIQYLSRHNTFTTFSKGSNWSDQHFTTHTEDEIISIIFKRRKDINSSGLVIL